MLISKKGFLALLLVLVMAATMVVLPACSDDDDDDDNAVVDGGGDSTVAADDGKTYKLKLAHTYPEGANMGIVPQKFADLVEEYTNGRVEVEIYPSGMLFGTRDLVPALQTGSLDVAWSPVYYMNNELPFMMVDNITGIWENIEHCRRFNTHPDVVAKIATALEENNMHFVGMVPMSFQIGWPATSREMKSLKDTAGMDVCAVAGYPDSPMTVYSGSNQVGLDATEMLTGYQTGMCEIYPSSFSNLVNFKIWELGGKHLLVIPRGFNGNILIAMSSDAWNKLPADLQDIIANEVVPAWQDFGYELLETSEVTDLETLIDNMDTVNYVTEAEMDDMWITTKDGSVTKMLSGMAGEEIMNLVESLRPSKD